VDKQQIRQRKKILSDPVTAYISAQPDTRNANISALEQVWHEYIDLKKHHKNVQIQCKQLSRQIGEAKKNGNAIDELMETMQTQTTCLKGVENQLEETSERILAFFEPNDSQKEIINTTASDSTRQTHVTPLKSDDKVSIERLTDEQVAWNEYVESNPAASIYHRAEWQALIQDTFKHVGYYLYARNNNHQIIGILPMIRMKSRMFGDFMVSMPYFNYGGAIADNPLIEQSLIQAANAIAEDAGVSHIEYRDDIPREELPAKTEKVNMILDLPDNTDKLWNTFTSKLRSQIRRPQRENVEILWGGEECLDDFYRVFARNMRDLGTPVYAKHFFLRILQYFQEHSKIVVLRMQHRPVAAAFLIGHKQTLEIPWASTIREVNHLSINMLLYWEVLKYAIDNNYRYFDFGRSSKESGTFRFKQQWGAKPKQLFWHYWLADDVQMPKLSPDNPKFKLAINIWKRLPVRLTRFLGPYIVRNLP
jgi:FemAB-related protein (PEP-CTERM system-associated)